MLSITCAYAPCRACGPNPRPGPAVILQKGRATTPFIPAISKATGPSWHGADFRLSRVPKAKRSAGAGWRCVAMAGSVSDGPPMSREDSISQAVSALNTQIEAAAGLRPGRRRGKGFSKGGSKKSGRMIVEVPVADESPSSTVQLVKDILDGVFREGEVSELTVVFADFEAAKAALKADLPSGVDVDYLEEIAGDPIKGNLMIVQPGEDEAGLVAELVGNWSGQVAILLNPGWNPFSPPTAQESLIGSFETVYSFLPVAMKIFVSTVEGAVFKRSSDDKWQIFQLKGEQFMAIGQQDKRPSNDNLEVAFANAAAATGNPLSNLFGRNKGK